MLAGAWLWMCVVYASPRLLWQTIGDLVIFSKALSRNSNDEKLETVLRSALSFVVIDDQPPSE